MAALNLAAKPDRGLYIRIRLKCLVPTGSRFGSRTFVLVPIHRTVLYRTTVHIWCKINFSQHKATSYLFTSTKHIFKIQYMRIIIVFLASQYFFDKLE
jgi:hypothetical protein